MLAFLAAALAASVHPSHPPAAQAPAPEAPIPESLAPAAPATEAAPAPAAEVAAAETALESAVPWWERITVTVDDKGKQQSCRYETSVKRAEECDAAMAASIRAGAKGGRNGVFSKVTFERRFTPGARPDAGAMKPGDTLLGRQVMYLTIDAKGSIASCKLVSTSGDVPPSYGCEEAKKEQFKAVAGADPAARPAFLTVSAYGHMEVVA